MTIEECEKFVKDTLIAKGFDFEAVDLTNDIMEIFEKFLFENNIKVTE